MGSETLTGGAGSDTFVFKPGDGQDTVNDFSLAQGDKRICRRLASQPATGDFGFMSTNPAGGETWHPLGTTGATYQAV